MGALIALVQTDIKRVLAYSTISQLGYMMLAMGVGSWVGGLFHLMTHAFFKALLFLGAGSVILAAGHEQEMPAVRRAVAQDAPGRRSPFAVAVLAIAGVPFFAGYYSKDMILRHAGAFAALATASGPGHEWRSQAGTGCSSLVPTAVAYLTAFYMTRCWMLTFWGKPRNRADIRAGPRAAGCDVGAAGDAGGPEPDRRAAGSACRTCSRARCASRR